MTRASTPPMSRDARLLRLGVAVDALTFLVPVALLAGPLRHVAGPRGRGSDAETITGTYREVLADPVFRRVLAFVFVSAFVGYGQIEGGWTAYANTIAGVSMRTIGLAFTANTTVIVLAFAVFAVGETLLSPVSTAIINDLASDRLRGCYNAVAGIAFQLAATTAAALAGVILGAGRGPAYIGMLVGGCAILAALAFVLEAHLSPHANGVAMAGRRRIPGDAAMHR